MERTHSGKLIARTEPMMYDVGVLGKFQTSNGNYYYIYYYIIEKMHVIKNDDDIKKDFMNLISLFEKFTDKIIRDIPELKTIYINLLGKEDVSNYDEQLIALMPIIIEYFNDNFLFKVDNLISKINEAYSLHENWVDLLIEEFIIKKITGRFDLHSGNVGITNNGQIRFFDPAI